ncbi:MAG: M56 family metallopeptidase [Peptococcaceae bacterium]|nr:M56 family metallopeptidase [Peptococcaceae bacterium]
MIIPGAFVLNLVRVVFLMTLSGSVLALLLLAIKPLVRHRLPQTAQYGLWLIVLAALLIPVSLIIVLPEALTNVSLAPVHAAIEQTILSPATAMNRAPSVLSAPDATAITGATDATGTTTSSPEIPPGTPLGLFPTLGAGFLIAYPLAVLSVLFYYLFGYAYFLGKIRCRRPAPLSDITIINKLCDGRPTPPVFLCELASTPMLVGLFRPMIILPDQTYTETQLETIMLHELTHLRRFDTIVKWLSVLACALHWFNPIVWLTRREVNRSCELSCDATVISRLNNNGRKRYGSTLIFMAADGKAPRAVLSTTLCEERKDLKERLLSIVQYKQHKRISLVASALIIIIAMGAVCLLGASAPTAEAAPGIQAVAEATSEDSLNNNSSGKAVGGNLIPNGDFESSTLPIPFMSCNGGSNTFAIDTINVKDGKAALKIRQSSYRAHAGYPLSLERDCTYDFAYDIMALSDRDGDPVANAMALTNFVFDDANSTNWGKNHLITDCILNSGEGWIHVMGSYKPASSRIAADADLENAWFSIYVDYSKPVVYVIDNVKLVKR